MPPETSPAARRGIKLGKYELLGHLASGGTADVYLARSAGTGGFEKVLVVKTLKEELAGEMEFVNMFLDEARIGAQLDHSNIVQTLDLGQDQGTYFIAMQYLAGLTLAALWRRSLKRVPGGMPLEIGLGIIGQACDGMHYVHEKTFPDGTPMRIVHRDLSPQNLLITFEGVVKILDFGVAHAAERQTQTKAGTIKGKFAYMAPEQVLGKPVDRRTDVFALGIMAHEVACGRRLFWRDSRYKIMSAVTSDPVPVPSQVNPELDPAVDAVILRALDRDPARRYQTAAELGEAIEELLIRRGKPVSSTKVARFLDEHFVPERDEQTERVEALVRGEELELRELWGADSHGDHDTEVNESGGFEDTAPAAAMEKTEAAFAPVLRAPPDDSGPLAKPPGPPKSKPPPTPTARIPTDDRRSTTSPIPRIPKRSTPLVTYVLVFLVTVALGLGILLLLENL